MNILNCFFINIKWQKIQSKLIPNTFYIVKYIKGRYICITNNKYNNKLMVFNKLFFFQQCLYYLCYYLIKRDLTNFLNIIHYIIIYLQMYINNFFFFDIIKSKQNKVILLNNKNDIITNLYIYFSNLIKYYSVPQHYSQLYNITNLNYIFTNIFFFLYKYNLITVIDDTWLKWIGIGFWTFITSAFLRKKYKEYKYSFNDIYFNKYKYKYKYNLYTNFSTFWKVYYKYGGNYQQYLYLKKFFLLNKTINKKKLLVYDFKVNKFIVKLNSYYTLLVNELKSDLNFKVVQQEQDHVYNLFNMFLKSKLDTPFLNDSIPFTYYYFKKNINKNELENLSYLISYDYLYKKIKKSSISDLSEKELFLNYKNFYLKVIGDNFNKNIVDVFGVELNEPFSTPARVYKKFGSWINFEYIFTHIDSFEIDTLYNYIIEAFTYIKQTDMMLSVNIDDIKDNDKLNNFDKLDAAIKNNEIDFFDYNIIKNDLNLTVRLNSEALKDSSFIDFLTDLKYLSDNATLNVLNLDLFETNFLQDNDMLTLFLKEHFFYLDYFTLAINSQKYSLCYLLFLFKVLKNKKNYELYYEKYCNKKINKYNKVVYDYHKHVSTKLQCLTNSFNGFVKYKTNKVLMNINNFDNINFINKLKKKNFNNFYMLNYKNNLKINYKNDYKEFLNYFEQYKSIKNFEKKAFNVNDLITFDEYLYNDINLNELLMSLDLKKKYIENLLQHYVYENNELLNFLNLGFYLYDIKGFETYQQDIFLFFEFKEHECLNFRSRRTLINEKMEFQKNYAMLYFHYLIKLFKNLKHYIFNIVIENIVFDDAFIYLNYDSTMHQKRIDFIYNVECFIKTLKTITAAKEAHIISFVNYLILHYAKFIEYNKVFDYNLLYDLLILEKCSKKDLYDLEWRLDDLMQLWKHLLDKIEETRKLYVHFIKILKLEKLTEFFEFPMFSKVKGFLLLKEAYYICVEELVIEERALDHAFNISMCLFRIFDKHNDFFKQEVLFKNGILTRLCYLSVEDWDYVLQLEKTNPLILIELYNSKQDTTCSEYWNNSISFLDIVYSISNISEKENAYNTLDDDWIEFLNKISTRDLIVYDLTEKDIINLNNIFMAYNNKGFNQLNVEDELFIFFEKNSLKYDKLSRLFKKIQNVNLSEETVDSEEFDNVDNVNEQQIIIEKKVNIINNTTKFLNANIIYLNNENDNMNTIIFNNIMDKKNKIVEANLFFLTFLSKKINIFKDSNFKFFLLQFFNILEVQYNDFTYLNNYKKFKESLNFLFYLTKFYNNITKLNNFDFLSISIISNKIINNEFNYFDNNNFINLDYINLVFKSITKKEQEKDWSNALSKSFNNRFLFLYYNAQDYLINILNFLDVNELYINNDLECNIDYLPNLNTYINKCNYNNNLIYNIYDNNFINTFDALFNALNIHILKANYMLTQFNIIKEAIFDVYLNHYELNKSNLDIIKELYFIVYKNVYDDNLKYLILMNLLLYVKDPIYLYNILVSDLKLYIQNIVNILDIIHKPELHNETYNNFIQFLMYKHNTWIEDWTKPLAYKGWAFSLYNTNRNVIKQKNIDKINVNYFFSYASVIKLNNAISNLDQYNGYFNLDSFIIKNQNCFNLSKESNLLNILHFDKLLYNFDFLFTINNIKGLHFYSLKEFILYNESNNFELLNKCFNFNDFWIHMLKQNYIYNNYLQNNLNDLQHKCSNQYKNLYVKEYEDLLIKKKKIFKRKSAATILQNKKRKTKIIKVLKKAELEPEDIKDDESEAEYEKDENEAGVYYKYVNLEVTDSDESESEANIIDNTVKKKEKINILEIKNQLVSNVHKDYIQWASDLEFRKAYFNCKDVFNTVLFDYSHPIWDMHKGYLVNETFFFNYVKALNEEDKLSIFNIFWDWTIKEVLDKREQEIQKKIEINWLNKLFHASKQTDPLENIRSTELLDIFCTNLKKNEKWKKKWHNDLYFLDMNRGLPGKESHWRGSEHWKEGHLREPDLIERQRGSVELNKFKKQDKQLELWDRFNWWKKW